MAKAMTPDVEQLMNDYFELRNGDTSKLDVLSETFTFHHPLGEVHGPDALVAMQRENEQAISDGAITVNEMLVGDNVAMWEWTLTGKHEGEWQGIQPSGNDVTIKGISKTVIADGKIQENWAYFDSQEFLTQLGGSIE